MTTAENRKLVEFLQRQFIALDTLCQRMEARQWSQTDPAYSAILSAEQALKTALLIVSQTPPETSGPSIKMAGVSPDFYHHLDNATGTMPNRTKSA